MVDTETSTTSCDKAVNEIENRQRHLKVKENDNQFINNGPSMMNKPHGNLHKIFTNHLPFRKKKQWKQE